jgi:DNA-directed RNA polymerase subunit RPC12/RpoP
MLINEARIRQLINLIGQERYSPELKVLAADLERRLLEGRARLARLPVRQSVEGEYTCSQCAQRSIVLSDPTRLTNKHSATGHKCPCCGSVNQIGHS